MSILFHPSSVGLLMGDAQSLDMSLVPDELQSIAAKVRKSDEEKMLLQPYKDMSLSAGAKTQLKTMAKEFLFNYRKEVETKYMDKGIIKEPDAIETLNKLWFRNYVKNTQRIEDEYLTGECDILDPGIETIDTKVSWDLSTFPMLEEDAHDSLYEWQGRAYMRLYNVPQHRVAFVLLDTPEHLVKPWDQQDLHKVEHYPINMRVTSITYQREIAKEEKMIAKLKIAKKYLEEVVTRMRLEHE